MWKVIFVLLPLATFAGDLDQFFHSSEAHKICEKSARSESGVTHYYLKIVRSFNDKIYFGFSHKNQTEVVIYDQKNQTQTLIKFSDKLVDIDFDSDFVYYLTESSLKIQDHGSDYIQESLRTLPNQYPYSKNIKAMELVVNESQAYIAHGELGLVIYDLAQRSFVDIFNPKVSQSNEGHRSLISGVAVRNNMVYLAYDNITLGRDDRAFEGIVLWDKQQSKIFKEIPINQRQEAYHLPSLSLDGENLFVTNFFLNFRHDLAKLAMSRTMKPQQRIWKYPDGELIGKGLIQENTVYGCFINKERTAIKAGFLKL